ncbi:sigma-54-dependent Fis family transcriptional regulator [Desulfopila sp. IMCC35008]|uniref:sigma-54 interaction domain-containing protein n=1 Tax=Desulfopila sp. IMCC35008 TaxID=2653858 RepID=UPI0013D0B373|nr:sigma-54 dependent transcriptional regulator [Desulfopila sp. IMCC35008]
MNKNELFREATLRICGNLEIEEALRELRLFLQEAMPVTHIFLQHYDAAYRAMRTIAYASESGYGKLDLLTPLSAKARELAANAPADQDAFLLTEPMAFPVSEEMTAFHGIQSSSVIVMTLRNRRDTIGYLVLVSEGKETFDDDDRVMIEQLKVPLVLSMSNALKHREVVALNDLLADDNRFLHGELRRLSGDEIIGARFGLKKVTRMVQQVAVLDSPVLLMGETGTGKDVIANAIHYTSSRSEGPFVSVNCGAIPDSLLDSELFGHEKGAFTGALSLKRGRFERAHKGTIFLDEIGELPLHAQTRLLRVLQNKEIERVGGVDTISLDIRIIAATNRHLETMVEKGDFREDLWFRLNVFPILVPPLRDRTVDIPALIQHFINMKAKELKLTSIPSLAPRAIEKIMNYGWPGNVRELQNVIERALILNPQGPLQFEHLGAEISKPVVKVESPSTESYNLDNLISHHISHVLKITKGRINGAKGAAALLGVNPSTLRNRMKRLGVSYGRKQVP